jgi:hypothetical protein
MTLVLDVVPGRLAIARLGSDAPLPAWAAGPPPTSITRTGAELSIVCAEALVPADVRHVGGYRALAVRGPLDFALTGIVSGLTAALAGAGVPVFVISTFDTDLVLVPDARLDDAVAALRGVGHEVAGG